MVRLAGVVELHAFPARPYTRVQYAEYTLPVYMIPRVLPLPRHTSTLHCSMLLETCVCTHALPVMCVILEKGTPERCPYDTNDLRTTDSSTTTAVYTHNSTLLVLIEASSWAGGRDSQDWWVRTTLTGQGLGQLSVYRQE